MSSSRFPLVGSEIVDMTTSRKLISVRVTLVRAHPGSCPGDTPYRELYGKAPPERGAFPVFAVYEKVGKFPILVC